MFFDLKQFIRSTLKHPAQTLSELGSDLHSDFLAKSGKVSGTFPLLFVAGLPKSGTTWLEQLLSVTPGLVQLNKSLLRDFPWYFYDMQPDSHDVHADMFNCAPKDSFSFLKRHAHPTDQNIKIIREQKVKTVVLIRDIRDMLISRFHHVMAVPGHWDHEHLVSLPEEEALYQSFISTPPNSDENILSYYVKWIDGWVDQAAKNPNQVLITKFEEMKNGLEAMLTRFFDFFEYSHNTTAKMIISSHEKRYPRTSCSLAESYKLTGRQHSTFRSGKVGDWQNVLTSRHLEIIEEYAGDSWLKWGY